MRASWRLFRTTAKTHHPWKEYLLRKLSSLILLYDFTVWHVSCYRTNLMCNIRAILSWLGAWCVVGSWWGSVGLVYGSLSVHSLWDLVWPHQLHPTKDGPVWNIKLCVKILSKYPSTYRISVEINECDKSLLGVSNSTWNAREGGAPVWIGSAFLCSFFVISAFTQMPYATLGGKFILLSHKTQS